MNAFYIEDRVYIGQIFAVYISQNYGPSGIMAVMAHEWGHHILKLLGKNQDERIADCLAGNFVSSQSALKLMEKKLHDEDIGKLMNLMKDIGDDLSSTPHGTPEARMYAFQYGLEHEVEECFFI